MPSSRKDIRFLVACFVPVETLRHLTVSVNSPSQPPSSSHDATAKRELTLDHRGHVAIAKPNERYANDTWETEVR